MDKSIYQQAVESGCMISNHASDLYIKVTDTSTVLIEDYPYKNNVVTFTSNIDNTLWYDVPFAYDPFWDKVSNLSKTNKS